MDIFNWIDTVLPVVGKKDIADDLEQIRDRLLKYAAPTYENLVKLFNDSYKFKSDYAKNFEAAFDKGSNFPYHHNHLHGILDTLNNNLLAIPVLRKHLSSFYTEEGSAYVSKKGMSLNKANVIRYLEVLNFIETYASYHAIAILAAEASMSDDGPEDHHPDIMPYESDYLAANQKGFIQAVNALNISAERIDEALNSVPDIAVTAESQDVIRATTEEGSADPLQLGFIPIKLNPIYHVRMAVANYQVKKYHEAKEEAELTEFKIAQLKRKLENEPANASLEQQIEYRRNVLNKLRREILDMEVKYG